MSKPQSLSSENKFPLVSVIIPTYNRASLILTTIESVVAQTYKNVEIIIADDGSTDNTESLVLSLKNPLIHYLKQENKGPSSARNLGIKSASGKFIAFLDSDDLWESDKLQKQVNVLINDPNVGLVYSHYRIFEIERNQFRKCITPKIPDENIHKDLIVLGNIVAGSASSVVLRKDLLELVGSFDQTLNAFEDLDLWRRIAKTGCKFHFIPSEDVIIRQHSRQNQNIGSFIINEGFKYIKKLRADEVENEKLVSRFVYLFYRDIFSNFYDAKPSYRVIVTSLLFILKNDNSFKLGALKAAGSYGWGHFKRGLFGKAAPIKKNPL